MEPLPTFPKGRSGKNGEGKEMKNKSIELGVLTLCFRV